MPLVGTEGGDNGFVVGSLGMAGGVWSGRQGGVQLRAVFFVKLATAAVQVDLVRDERMGDGARFSIG